MLLSYNQEMYRSMRPMQPGKHFLFQQKVFFAVAKQGKNLWEYKVSQCSSPIGLYEFHFRNPG